MSCDSWDSNAPFDIIPRPNGNDHLNPVACYLGEEGMDKYLTHPYASPLFGDFEGLPPMLVQCGDAEVLRDEVTLLAHKATLAGVHVQHELFQDAVCTIKHIYALDVYMHCIRSTCSKCSHFSILRTNPSFHAEHLWATCYHGINATHLAYSTLLSLNTRLATLTAALSEAMELKSILTSQRTRNLLPMQMQT